MAGAGVGEGAAVGAADCPSDRLAAKREATAPAAARIARRVLSIGPPSAARPVRAAELSGDGREPLVARAQRGRNLLRRTSLDLPALEEEEQTAARNDGDLRR